MFAGKVDSRLREDDNVVQSPIFLYLSCLFIFAFSIFLRSSIDIGADTGVYLDLGKKVFLGEKYYYGFFESNFPLSFYYYAIQYWLSSKLNLSQIILSEIFINLLELSSIIFSAKILRRSTISQNPAHYNLIIISYFAGFFLRPYALQIGEFGTKTSLLLILLYPYISYSFARISPLDKKDLIARGSLMGLMPCIKPHYLILMIPIEIYRFCKAPSWRFFFELDKLVMALVGSLVLFLMIKFTPEYFEFIPPMWKKTYQAYDDSKIFLENFWHSFAIIMQFALIFLVFARAKFDENNRILALFFFSATALVLVENIGTVDQMVVFYAVATICFFKFIFDLFAAQKNILSGNLFIISALIFLPVFDMEVLPAAFLGLGGFVNVWWLVVLYNFVKPAISHVKFILLYALALAIVFGAFKLFGAWAYVATNLFVLLSVLFFFERKNAAKNLSPLAVFAIFAAITTLLYAYVSSIAGVFTKESPYSSPHKISDMIAYYSKKYAPNKDESFLMNSIWIAHQFPFLNYLEKDNLQKFHVSTIQANHGKGGSILMFENNDSDKLFAYSYLFDDVRNAVQNPQIKVIFFNNSAEIMNKKDRCLIPTLEYYLLDPTFRKNFLKNFHFENHVIIVQKKRLIKKINFITGEKPSIFDQVKPSEKQILHDFEVYVRN
jgi:hypothetical protein